MLCRCLEVGIECVDEPGREMCLCDGNFCNLFLPALRETQPQLEFWHALILLAPVLLVLLALGATAFWALRRRRSDRYTFNPPERQQETSPRLIMVYRNEMVVEISHRGGGRGGGGGGRGGGGRDGHLPRSGSHLSSPRSPYSRKRLKRA